MEEENHVVSTIVWMVIFHDVMRFSFVHAMHYLAAAALLRIPKRFALNVLIGNHRNYCNIIMHYFSILVRASVVE